MSEQMKHPNEKVADVISQNVSKEEFERFTSCGTKIELESDGKILKYKWNYIVGNYCLTEHDAFVVPLERLKLETLSQFDLPEILQNAFYLRTGRINPEIGLSYENDKAIAIKLGVW